MKNLLKNLLICTSIALITACGSQDGTNNDVASVNIASTAPKNVANQDTSITMVGTSPKRDLLANLAIAYPGGVLPAERAAAAATQLKQNPAALTFNASAATGSPSGSSLGSPSSAISPQSGAIQPQAATSYTFGQYALVQRAQNTTLFGSYFSSIYPSEMANALVINPTWNLEGPAFYASLGINPGLAPVWRFRNIINGSYLYTINDGEKNDIIANYSAYFVLEGPAWYASPEPVPGFSPLYRFRNLTNGTYLFSAYEAEKNAIVANYAGVFLLEGISYYVQQAAPLELRSVAGSSDPGNTNGAGAAAQMNGIFGMLQAGAGNILVTNFYGHNLRVIQPDGLVYNFVGAAGVPGATDGPLSVARFKNPWGIVRDSAGGLFVSDYGNEVIRKISAGNVRTFAGARGANGSADGTGNAARFSGPSGMTIDSADNIYVVDQFNSTIRKVTPSGVVSTIAGSAGLGGLVNGTGAAARFSNPRGIAIDSLGNLFVADTNNNAIRKITPAGVVSTFAGGTLGRDDGTGTNAKFTFPTDVTIDANNNLYTNGLSSGTVRKITPGAVVTTVVGTADGGPLTEGTLPSTIGYQDIGAVRVFGNDLYIGMESRLLKVNGLP